MIFVDYYRKNVFIKDNLVGYIEDGSDIYLSDKLVGHVTPSNDLRFVVYPY